MVDSCNTHNFLNPSVVKRTRIYQIFQQVIKVTMANGEEMLSEGKCTDVCLKLQGNTLCSEFFVLALGGCDVVLGVQWCNREEGGWSNTCTVAGKHMRNK
jgi:hypothetical protein